MATDRKIESRKAGARRLTKPDVLRAMPNERPINKRNRALIAFLSLTGARAEAVASIRLHHVDVAGRFVDQPGAGRAYP
jgi:integrase